MLSVDGQANALLCQAQGLEGIVLKRKDSRYEINKRSKSWLKVINYQYIDFWIYGLRKGDFGWILAFPNGQHGGDYGTRSATRYTKKLQA